MINIIVSYIPSELIHWTIGPFWILHWVLIPNDILTCGFSSRYDPLRGVSLLSGTAVSQQQNRGAEGEKENTHFSKLSVSSSSTQVFGDKTSWHLCQSYLCLSVNHKTETTRNHKIWPRVMRSWKGSMAGVWEPVASGGFETNVTSVMSCGGQRLQLSSALRLNRKPGGEEDAPLPSGDTSTRQTPAMPRPQAPTPLSRSLPQSPLISSFLSSLSHCKV